MLVKATVAMSPKAPTENSANPEAEYSSAASMACRVRNPSKALAKCPFKLREGSQGLPASR